MAGAKWYTKIKVALKVNLLRVKEKDLEECFLKMVNIILGFGKIIKWMVEDFIAIMILVSIKDNLLIIKNQVKVLNFILIIAIFKVLSTII